jgi:hypothetical protein
MTPTLGLYVDLDLHQTFQATLIPQQNTNHIDILRMDDS